MYHLTSQASFVRRDHSRCRWVARRRGQALGDPRIEALARLASGQRDRTMNLRIEAHDELAGERPVRLLAALGAPLQVVVDRLPKRPAQLVDGTALEGNHIARVDDLAVKQSRLGVEGHMADVTLVLHHGTTPASTR